MAQFRKVFTTKATKEELRTLIDRKLAKVSDLRKILPKTWWAGDVMHIDSKIGSGALQVEDYRLVVDLELTLFGMTAQKKIEAVLEQELKLLDTGKKTSD